ncbi:MAG TPA: magnesium transporter [archaeon]|nr:magnesium transporter [archaeon]
MWLSDKNFHDILYSQLFSVAAGLLAGLALFSYKQELFLLPGLLILLPGFLEMRGSISGSFASRISSGLFLGVISHEKLNTRLIRSNLIASFALALLVSFALGTIASLFTFFFSGAIYLEIIVIAVLAGLIANAIEIPIALFSTFYLFRKGHDPNNVIGPFILSTGDLVSILSLMVAVAVV